MTKIAGGISSNRLEFKAAYKRIQRNIQNYPLDLMYTRAQRNSIAMVTADHIIAVDIGDVSKPHAKTMEGLATVADGSEGHALTSGFWLIGAIAVNPSSTEKTPLPIHLELYSASEPSFVSENHVVNRLCTKVASLCEAAGTRPTIVIDRGGDRPAILKNLFGLPVFTVVRLNRRHLEDSETGEKFPVPMGPERDNEVMVSKATVVRVSKTGKRMPMKIRFGARKVHLPSKITSVLLGIVVFQIDKHANPIYLITNKPFQSEQQIMSVILAYLARWSIEETYRFLKAGNGIESVRTQFLHSTKQLIAASFIAACFLWKCAMDDEMRLEISEKSFRLKRAPQTLYNWMYRAADHIAMQLRELNRSLRLMRFHLQQTRTIRKHGLADCPGS
jgi:hypothetical protein